MRADQDVFSGLFFIALGTLGLWLGWDYAFGTAARMGPGFVPKLLCSLLVAAGIVTLAIGLMRRGLSMERWQIRPLLLVLASVLVFAALIETAGLVPATVGMVLVAAAGSQETRWLEMTVVSAMLAAASVLIFIKGLGLTMKILPGS